ncbi:MAG TPA: protein-disulfide reductase DsbD N-terminal domain-containing protein [Blastocatellia bacterium]|nr:protein-disulfide reductase DsbD N-terminal domain-containing protein [Blastocatellia bacterium]HMV86402.1 protein-disulfide reductase DsbD N-terminal domain-containing protein [Blastocatellia bacterium]HMX27619.1 protein-disulfide reductase DsbD N-terminal domain-containing protein [Blastocatellia bacterium]HMY74533.1 protein-disulfide reductase DsbD N-terminal domain-containing protein [Blastocatellia bacterium]HMZ18708.1 protein-disulfide reductase DsbD N-terminal domain-containing protei
MNRQSLIRFLWAAALFISVAAHVFAQESSGVQFNPIKWSLKLDSPAATFKAGDQIRLLLTAEIEDGWHLYSLDEIERGPKPTRISLASDQLFELADIESPEPQSAFDENFGIPTQFYEHAVTFTLPVTVATKAPAGKRKLIAQARYQTCTDKLCLPPKLVKTEVEVEITAGK